MTFSLKLIVSGGILPKINCVWWHSLNIKMVGIIYIIITVRNLLSLEAKKLIVS